MSTLQAFFDEMKAHEKPSTESVDIDVGELLEYCIESKHRELNELGRFIDRIDSSIDNLKSEGDIASFEADISKTLEYTGGVGLEKLFIPSFESSDVAVYATEAEEKAEAAKKPLTEKMMDGIRYLIKKLKQFGLWLKKHLYDRWKKKGETVQDHLDKQAAKAKAATSGKAEGVVVEPGDKITLVVPKALVKGGRLRGGEAVVLGTQEFDKHVKDVLKILTHSTPNNTDRQIEDVVDIETHVSSLKKMIEALGDINPSDVVHVTYSHGLVTDLIKEMLDLIKHHDDTKEQLLKAMDLYTSRVEQGLNNASIDSSSSNGVRRGLGECQRAVKDYTDFLDKHLDKVAACMKHVRVSIKSEV